MKRFLQKVFGVERDGWPSLPNTRIQLVTAGMICLALWPGVWALLIATDQLDPSERGVSLLSPFLLVSVLGIYLIGQALVSTRERRQFTKKTPGRKRQ